MPIRYIPDEQIESVYELLKELRPHIKLVDFISIYEAAKKADQYCFYAYMVENQCVGLMGLRYLHDYVHQFHLYIDDLVVKPEFRSQKIGAQLLQFAEKLAREKNCTGLRLSTGAENAEGIRFYQRENWIQRAVVFKKKI